MSQPLIVFSHGNSFPASTYSVMLDELRRRGFRVEAIEKFGHDPRYPVTNNWPHLVDQLSDFLQAFKHHDQLYLVGHSLGGFLSLMAAAQNPKLVKGVVLMDSPLVAGWRANVLRMSKHLSVAERFTPAAVSRKRRESWGSEQEALEHFQSKRVFAKWHPQVLRDYVAFGTHDQTTTTGMQRVLSFDRDIETRIYRTLPDHIEGYIQRHPLHCKAALIGGLQSKELKRVGLKFSRRITQGRVFNVDGTHLFPMEHPIVTAAAVEAALLNLMV